MKYLIDSHVLVWLLGESHKVGPKTKELLRGEDSIVYVSDASYWELGLKFNNINFFLSPKKLLEGSRALGVSTLPITTNHILDFFELKMKHKDPFDLMLCAQASTESMSLITSDTILLKEFTNSINASE